MVRVGYIWPVLALRVVSSYQYSPTEKLLPRLAQEDEFFNMRNYLIDIKNAPYHVMVYYKEYFCSGSLVASKIVATAASCFHKYKTKYKVFVRYGSDHMVGGMQVKVEEVKLHEFYRRIGPVDNDIAILYMRDHVSFGDGAMKIVLNEPDTSLQEHSWVRVTGWGFGNVLPQIENRLIWSEMEIMNDFECGTIRKKLKTPSNFCGKFARERHLSDNGGPAVYKGLLVGISSFGAHNNEAPHIALFTNVSYFHRWIVKNTKYFLEKYCENRHFNFADEVDDFGGDDI